MAAAGYTSLAALFPSQQAGLYAKYTADLAAIQASPAAIAQGDTLGTKIANDLLALRANDGASTAQYPYIPIAGPGNWRPTPPENLPYLLPGWGNVTPFTMTSNAQFTQPAPPALTSPEYALAFNRVKELGAADSATRSTKDTNTAFFWADGPGTYTPPGHWNAIAQEVTPASNTLIANARTFALLNLALGDAAIAAWDMKLDYHFWRPVTGIREADTDGNAATDPDPGWTPLVTTPPFPAYVSGHSTFSAAAAAILTELFGDNVSFKDVSEYPFSDPKDGERIFANFLEARNQAGESRIFGGIHWDFDNFYGLQAGEALGEYVSANYLAPLPGSLVLSLSGLAAMFIARRVRRR